jgi:hypothetical protein
MRNNICTRAAANAFFCVVDVTNVYPLRALIPLLYPGVVRHVGKQRFVVLKGD